MDKEEIEQFNLITEAPGMKATKEQLERLYQRYRFAKQFCINKDVLEIACGTGIGLGYFKNENNIVKGGDIDSKNIEIAKKHYQGRKIDIVMMNAEKIELADNSFDSIIFFEAIYYLKNPELFVQESYRILRNGGTIILSTVNKDWDDFHPSPYITKYYSVPELAVLFKDFKSMKFYGGFPTANDKPFLSKLKQIAIKFNLIPGSLKARAYLKRIFMGKLLQIPNEIFDGLAEYEEPSIISSDCPNRDFKILYLVAKKSF